MLQNDDDSEMNEMLRLADFLAVAETIEAKCSAIEVF